MIVPRRWWAVIGLSLVTAMAAPVPCAAQPAETPAKRAMIEAADRGDYFLWKRILDRIDNPVEFPRPDSYYQPSVLVEGAPDQPLASDPAPWLSPSTRAAIERYATPRKTGAVLILRDGRVAYEFYASGYHSGSLLAVRSLAKALPTLLVGIAQAEGKIASIDDPVARYLTEWRTDPRGAITLRQLMQYASGLAAIPQRIEPANRALRLAEGSDITAETLAWPRAGAGGVGFSFNQVDQQLLALVVERATGEPYQRYLSSRLWRPIGAGTATLNVDAKGTARAFCCMRSMARDWLRVGELIAHGGHWAGRQVVPAAFIDEMKRPSSFNPQIGAGLFRGWRRGTTQAITPAVSPYFVLQSAPYAADDLYFIQGGRTISLWIMPSRRLVMLRWGEDTPDWDPSVIPNLVLSDVAKRVR